MIAYSLTERGSLNLCALAQFKWMLTHKNLFLLIPVCLHTPSLHASRDKNRWPSHDIMCINVSDAHYDGNKILKFQTLILIHNSFKSLYTCILKEKKVWNSKNSAFDVNEIKLAKRFFSSIFYCELVGPIFKIKAKRSRLTFNLK